MIDPQTLSDLLLVDARNPGTMRALVARFTANQRSFLDDPRLQPDSLDRVFAGDGAHRLKGTAGTLGATELAECALQLERLAPTGDAASLSAQVQRLREAFDGASRMLAAAFPPTA
ncbi:MAG: Hpt domain-containing protein [Rhodanobacteraceae bacterium]|nr:Hpt domain-containing protein [Rhodanobacteraceae bacterium]